MRTVIIVQARMTSTRLPGKVLKTVLNKPLLEYQIERLQRVKLADEVIVATTTNETDIPIVELCNRLGVPYFRGSENDVLARYYAAATVHQAEAIVRLTSDCPIIDPEVIDQVIGFYLQHHPKNDYVSNSLSRSYPRGMDTEIFSMKALTEAFNEATEKPDREHVTPFIYSQPQRYSLANIAFAENQSCHRWTVDTPEDFELISRIIETLYTRKLHFTLEDCLELFKLHPDWVEINADIEQKKLGQ
jgi:spore coat polysaccharide biosynthesis protein SpsF